MKWTQGYRVQWFAKTHFIFYLKYKKFRKCLLVSLFAVNKDVEQADLGIILQILKDISLTFKFYLPVRRKKWDERSSPRALPVGIWSPSQVHSNSFLLVFLPFILAIQTLFLHFFFRADKKNLNASLRFSLRRLKIIYLERYCQKSRLLFRRILLNLLYASNYASFFSFQPTTKVELTPLTRQHLSSYFQFYIFRNYF